MARSSLVGFQNAGSGGVKGAARTAALLEAIPVEVVANLKRVFETAADRIVDTLHRVLPLDELDPHPGALRESAHREAGPTEISAKVVVDAKDEKGRPYAKHVEHGHKAKNGGHVPPKPAFYPVIRLEKKRIRREAAKALRDGCKTAAARTAGVAE